MRCYENLLKVKYKLINLLCVAMKTCSSLNIVATSDRFSVSASKTTQRSSDSPARDDVKKGICKTAYIIDRISDHLEIYVGVREESDDGVGGPGEHHNQTNESSSDNYN